MRRIFILVLMFAQSFSMAADDLPNSMIYNGNFQLMSQEGSPFTFTASHRDLRPVKVEIGRPSLLSPKRLFNGDRSIVIDLGEVEFNFWVPNNKYNEEWNFVLEPTESGQPVTLVSRTFEEHETLQRVQFVACTHPGICAPPPGVARGEDRQSYRPDCPGTQEARVEVVRSTPVWMVTLNGAQGAGAIRKTLKTRESIRVLQEMSVCK